MDVWHKHGSDGFHFVFCCFAETGAHEEIDYSAKLKFSDDEGDEEGEEDRNESKNDSR